MDNWIPYACLWLGFVTAVVAGVFLSFSDFIMAGLFRAKPESGIDTMQQINRTVFRSVFLTAFLLLIPLTTGFALYAFAHTSGFARGLILAATATYLLGVVVVTIACNVPMNERLENMSAPSDEARLYWRVYYRRWTRWNHVRAIGSAAASALFMMAATTL